jgi:cytochrome c oxidase assembly factor CtaG
MSTDPSLSTTLTAWRFEPQILLGLVLLAVAYVSGLRDLARRGRLHTIGPWPIASFASGLLALLLALVSPLDTFDTQLFAIHMAQHLLLLMVAPPLLLLGKPVPVLLRGLPRSLVRRVARAHARTPWLHGVTRRLASPLVAWTLYVGDMLLWHAPVLYQATLQYQGIHLLEHGCFFGTGLVFWWAMVEPLPGPARVRHGWRLTYTAAAVLPNTALGALLTFAATPWYPFYAAAPRLWGFSVMDDQRLAGLIMWVPGDMVHLAAAAALFCTMLAQNEHTVTAEDVARQTSRPLVYQPRAASDPATTRRRR